MNEPCPVCRSTKCDESPIDFGELWDREIERARHEYDNRIRAERKALWAAIRRGFRRGFTLGLGRRS